MTRALRVPERLLSAVLHFCIALVSLRCYTHTVPTKHRRILVTNDPQLADALARAEPYFRGAPTATIVHDLAVRGARALEREGQERELALARLVAFSTGREDLIDWTVLERIDDLAWGE